jgi:hypothetical protein
MTAVLPDAGSTLIVSSVLSSTKLASTLTITGCT